MLDLNDGNTHGHGPKAVRFRSWPVALLILLFSGAFWLCQL